MTDSQCVDYLENICKMFVNGSKNCEGSALEYQQMYISAIRHAIAKLQSEPHEDEEPNFTSISTGYATYTAEDIRICSNCKHHNASEALYSACRECINYDRWEQIGEVKNNDNTEA